MKPKTYIEAFTGTDSEGDAVIYVAKFITKTDKLVGYLNGKGLEDIVTAINTLCNKNS